MSGPISMPRALLMLEGGVVAVISVIAYAQLSGNWLLFILLILAPDLSALGYLAGPRVGSVVYNTVHTYALPLVIGTIAWFAGNMFVVSLMLIWMTHIGGDRMLSFGLKYPTQFKDTHLNRV